MTQTDSQNQLPAGRRYSAQSETTMTQSQNMVTEGILISVYLHKLDQRAFTANLRQPYQIPSHVHTVEGSHPKPSLFPVFQCHIATTSMMRNPFCFG